MATTIKGIILESGDKSKICHDFTPQLDSDSRRYVPLDRSLNVFIGENGAGKTAYLRAIEAAAHLLGSPSEGLVQQFDEQTREQIRSYLWHLKVEGHRSRTSWPRESLNGLWRPLQGLPLSDVQVNDENMDLYLEWVEQGLFLISNHLDERYAQQSELNFLGRPYTIVPVVFLSEDSPKIYEKVDALKSIFQKLAHSETVLGESKMLQEMLWDDFEVGFANSALLSDRFFGSHDFAKQADDLVYGNYILLNPIPGDAIYTPIPLHKLITDARGGSDKIYLVRERNSHIPKVLSDGFPSVIHENVKDANELFKDEYHNRVSIDDSPNDESIFIDKGEATTYARQIIQKINILLQGIMPALSKTNYLEGTNKELIERTTPYFIPKLPYPFNLSNAETRWFNLAANFAISQPKLLLIDEPEHGLHRQIELKLATTFDSNWLEECTICVATHSPSFLASESCNVHAISSGKITSSNTKFLELLPSQFRDFQKLGISPSDLLTLVKGILVVEGEHDLTILNTYFKQEFQDLRIFLMAGRGAKNFPGVYDAQILSNFTNCPLFVLLDNTNSEVTNQIWDETKTRFYTEGFTVAKSYLVRELRNFGSGEAKWLGELLTAYLNSRQIDKIQVLGLSKLDIIMYLPESVFKLNREWGEYESDYLEYKGKILEENRGIRNFRNHKRIRDFKEYLKMDNPDFQERLNMLNDAILDTVPHEEFISLMDKFQSIFNAK